MTARAATVAKAPNCRGPMLPAMMAKVSICRRRLTAMETVMMLMLLTRGERSRSVSRRSAMRPKPVGSSEGEFGLCAHQHTPS